MQQNPANLVALLDIAAAEMGAEPLYTFLHDGTCEGETVAAAPFREQVLRIASYLRSEFHPGSRILIALPSGIDFIRAFFACQYAGVIAVPIYPLDARSRRHSKATLEHLERIAGDCRAEAILASSDAFAEWDECLSSSRLVSKLNRLSIDGIKNTRSGQYLHNFEVSQNDIAFLQYTSGSTADPKGVMVSHMNLVENLATIAEAAFGKKTRVVLGTWLPLYHDLGLISCVLLAPFTKSRLVFMDPMRFIQRPSRWLKMINYWRVYASGGPNFAYDLCNRAVPSSLRDELDLSCWKVAYNCAEPIRSKTVVEFEKGFARCGFTRLAFFPSYGLAEGTLNVAADDPTLPVRMTTSDFIGQTKIVTCPDDGSGLRVSSGRQAPGVQIHIVDPDAKIPLDDGVEGEVWVRGPNVARGYWNRPALTAETFEARTSDGDGPYLRTGDIGYVTSGELFITGRIKDVIIVRGKQIYPSDVEDLVQALDKRLKASAGIAFSFNVDGIEQLAIAHETTASEADMPFLARQVWSAVAARFQIPPAQVILLPVGGIPKTFNGKLQRQRFRAAYREGNIPALFRLSMDSEAFIDAIAE